MDFDEDILFVRGIPQDFPNSLLTELLATFGEIKTFRRGRDLDGADSPWVLVSYYDPASGDVLRNALLSGDTGLRNATVCPAGKESAASGVPADVLARIASISRKYSEMAAREDLLARFVSSYTLLYGSTAGDKAFSDSLKKWLVEEDEIRRRCRSTEHGLERAMEKKREEEYHRLSAYDDDKSNDLFYLDRASWTSSRSKNIK